MRRIGGLLAAGALFGALSRIEEVAEGFSAGISSNSAWLVVAALAGLAMATAARAAALGAAVLTVANLAYYAWIGVTEPSTDLAQVAGPPATWFVLGLSGGAVFGALGFGWRAGDPRVRLGAALLIAGLLIADGITGVREGAAGDAVGLAAGIALPIVSARGRALQVVAGAGVLAIAAVGWTGVFEPLLP